MSLDTLLKAAQYLDSTEAEARGSSSVWSKRCSSPLQRPALSDPLREPFERSTSSNPKTPSRSDVKQVCICKNTFEIKEKRRILGAGTREVHNELEKNRRAHLRECYDVLKKELPIRDKKASNLSILRCALRYIQSLKRKDEEYEVEIKYLKQQKLQTLMRLKEMKKFDDGDDVNVELGSTMKYFGSVADDELSNSTSTASECGSMCDTDDGFETSLIHDDLTGIHPSFGRNNSPMEMISKSTCKLLSNGVANCEAKESSKIPDRNGFNSTKMKKTVLKSKHERRKTKEQGSKITSTLKELLLRSEEKSKRNQIMLKKESDANRIVPSNGNSLMDNIPYKTSNLTLNKDCKTELAMNSINAHLEDYSSTVSVKSTKSSQDSTITLLIPANSMIRDEQKKIMMTPIILPASKPVNQVLTNSSSVICKARNGQVDTNRMAFIKNGIGHIVPQIQNQLINNNPIPSNLISQPTSQFQVIHQKDDFKTAYSSTDATNVRTPLVKKDLLSKNVKCDATGTSFSMHRTKIEDSNSIYSDNLKSEAVETTSICFNNVKGSKDSVNCSNQHTPPVICSPPFTFTKFNLKQNDASNISSDNKARNNFINHPQVSVMTVSSQPTGKQFTQIIHQPYVQGTSSIASKINQMTNDKGCNTSQPINQVKVAAPLAHVIPKVGEVGPQTITIPQGITLIPPQNVVHPTITQVNQIQVAPITTTYTHQVNAPVAQIVATSGPMISTSLQQCTPNKIQSSQFPPEKFIKVSGTSTIPYHTINPVPVMQHQFIAQPQVQPLIMVSNVIPHTASHETELVNRRLKP